MLPLPTVLATEEPEYIPSKALEITATLAGPHAGACDGVCQIHEEGADAGFLQEGAEDDKQHDKGGADGDGGRRRCRN